MKSIPVAWFDNDQPYGWLKPIDDRLLQYMIPVERFEFLSDDPQLTNEWFWFEDPDHYESIVNHHVFGDEAFHYLNNSVLGMIRSETDNDKRSFSYDAIQVFVEEMDIHINKLIHNGEFINYDAVISWLLYSSFDRWFDNALDDDIVCSDTNEEISAMIKKYAHCENIAKDIINRYLVYRYESHIDPHFLDEMAIYDDNYRDGLIDLQHAVIWSLQYNLLMLEDTDDEDIDIEILRNISMRYQQVFFIWLALFYLEQIGR